MSDPYLSVIKGWYSSILCIGNTKGIGYHPTAGIKIYNFLN
jgi:hypothetical protein